MKLLPSTFWGVLFLFSACESNPFFGTDKIPDRKITGKVSAQFLENHGDVYVWLEGADLLTQTQEDGSFSLSLPTPGEAGAGTIVSGSYKLYFYLANYKLEFVTIEFLNGEIIENLAVIKKDGQLKKSVYLENILTLETKISPKSYFKDEDDSIKVNVILIPNSPEVFIETIVRVDSGNSITRTGFLIFDENNKLIQSANVEGSRTRREIVASPKKEWTAIFQLNESLFSKGEYDVIPYIVLDRSDVPKKLASAIGSNYKSFTQNFIIYPIKRKGGKLIVQ